MKTYLPIQNEIKKKWYLIDANEKVLGRLCSKVASILRGKHKPIFTPHMDTGDNIIIINADKVVLKGDKLEQKIYYRHTGYIGGLKEVVAKDMLKRRPERVFELAIWGMLPKNKLGRKILKNVKIYKGAEHPHASQMPEVLEIK